MTRKLPYIIAFICLLIIFSSCQKEFSIEEGITDGTTTGTAAFTFSGTPGNCTSPVVNGIFHAGTPLDSSNRLTVQVNVTDTGTYSISTSSANGIVFSAADTFMITGQQTIVLTAIGTPVAAGSFSFTFGTGSCTFSVTCTGDIVNNGDCKSCIYLPFCPGSTYLYSDTVVNPISEDTTFSERHADFLSSTDTTIDGKAYKKIGVYDGANTNFSYANCSDGVTTTIAYNVQSTTSGNVLVSIKSIDLKANAPIGTSWSDTAVYASGNILYRKHTIAEKGISRNVSGVNYSDVIKVSVDQSILYPGPPPTLIQAGVTEYYIASGTGLIETVTFAENPITSQTYMAYHSILKSVFIP